MSNSSSSQSQSDQDSTDSEVDSNDLYDFNETRISNQESASRNGTPVSVRSNF